MPTGAGGADAEVIFKYSGDTTGIDKANNEAETKVKSSSDKLSNISKVAGAAVAGAAVAVGAAAIKFGTDYEQSMANASTLFGDAKVNMSDLNSKVLELSNTSGVASSEIGDALYQALSSGIAATDDMGTSMAFLESSTKLAKSGFTTLESVVDVTTTVLNSYGMGVEETDRVQRMLQNTQDLGKTTVNELAASLAQVTPIAASMKVGFDQVSAGLAVMTAQGVPTAQATTQLKSLFAELGKSGTEGADALAAAAEGTKYAGMSFSDMMAKGVPLNDVLNLMGDYAGKNGVSMLDMFGSIEAGNAALSMSGTNSEAFGKALQGMTSDVDSVGNAYDKITGTSGAGFEKLLNTLKNTAIDLFLQLEPLITMALPILTTLFKELLPPLMDLVKMILPPLVELFNIIIVPLSDLLKQIMPPLVEIFNMLLPPLMELVSALLPPLIVILNALIVPFMDLIQLILPVFVDLIMVIVDVINKLAPVITWLAGMLSDNLGSAFESIGGIIRNVIGYFKSIIDFIKNVFTGNWSAAWQNVKDIFSNLIGAISGIFKLPINLVIGGMNALIGGLNAIKLPDWEVLGKWAGKSFNIPQIPKLRVGLDYVPNDDYPALLHKGEAVLNASQASKWRAGENRIGGYIGGFDDVRGIISQAFAAMAKVAAAENTIIVRAGDIFLDGRKITESANEHNYTDLAVKRL